MCPNRTRLPKECDNANPFELAIHGEQSTYRCKRKHRARCRYRNCTFSAHSPHLVLTKHEGGPPVVEAVPDSVQLKGKQLWYSDSLIPVRSSNLNVRAVISKRGTNTPFITGDLAIDSLTGGTVDS